MTEQEQITEKELKKFTEEMMQNAPQQPKSANDFFIVCMPSRNQLVDMNTSWMIHQIAAELDLFLMASVSDMPLTWLARNQTLRKLKRDLDAFGIEHEDTVPVFWWDDDVHIKDSLAKCVYTFKTARERKISFVTNYKLLWTDNSVMNSIASLDPKDDQLKWLTNMQLARYNNLDKLPAGSGGGLGFAFIYDMPLDYNFHSDPIMKGQGVLGEDLNMYRELFKEKNKDLFYSDIKLGHRKNVLL